MTSHPYLRAYMAGISVPTPLLLVALTIFAIARFAYNVPVPVERVIIFPMAIIPNLFGIWNMLHLALRGRVRLPLGIHGAILPLILAPAGFLIGRCLGFLKATENGFIYFGMVEIPYALAALVFSAMLIVYYLVWKHLIGFFNRVAGVAD
jgi:hypothetical protein